MILNIDKYRSVNVPIVKRWVEQKGSEDLTKTISELSAITGVHIVAICQYLGEIIGFTPELREKMNRLGKFYSIEELWDGTQKLDLGAK